MHRARKLIVEADNPSALESRLLLSSAAEPRYAFLRSGGRHHAVWLEIRSGRLREQRAPAGGPLVGDYSDSSEDDETAAVAPPLPPQPAPAPPPTPPPIPGESVKQARAREWAERRKQAREASAGT